MISPDVLCFIVFYIVLWFYNADIMLCCVQWDDIRRWGKVWTTDAVSSAGGRSSRPTLVRSTCCHCCRLLPWLPVAEWGFPRVDYSTGGVPNGVEGMWGSTGLTESFLPIFIQKRCQQLRILKNAIFSSVSGPKVTKKMEILSLGSHPSSASQPSFTVHGDALNAILAPYNLVFCIIAHLFCFKLCCEFSTFFPPLVVRHEIACIVLKCC